MSTEGRSNYAASKIFAGRKSDRSKAEPDAARLYGGRASNTEGAGGNYECAVSHRKLETPMDFTLRELERACKKLHIPMVKLCECLMASDK